MGNFFKKHKTKLVVLIIILVGIGAALFVINKKANQLPVVSVVPVEKSDLINAVNLTGTVESDNSNKVYTSLALPVDKNLVEVGDSVKVGDVLCQLDTKTLDNSIATSRASAGAAAAQAADAIKLSEKQLKQSLADLENDKDGTIFQAEQGVVQAEMALERAEISYDGTITALRNARNTTEYMTDEDTRSIRDPAVNQRDSAYAAYESAKQGVQDAKDSLNLAKYNANKKIDSLKDQINTAQIASTATSASWISIGHLETDVANATITSPVDGVITAMYVTEGATATGLMYVIEDIETLKVTANLKEYDLALVELGNYVEIKSDATGEEIFDGKVDYIAPTTTKNITGDNIVGTGGLFETDIHVDSKKSGLRIGTKARMDIVYEKKENIMSIAYESLAIEDVGGVPTSMVYTLEEETAGINIYLVKAIPIETGMETDFLVEVRGDTLKEGDFIMGDITGFTEGMRVQLPEGASLAEYTAAINATISEANGATLDLAAIEEDIIMGGAGSGTVAVRQGG